MKPACVSRLSLIFAAAALSITTARPARGEPTGLTDWFDEQLARTPCACSGDDAPDSSLADEWRLRRFSVNLRAGVGLTIPGGLGLRVAPEMELMWERED